MHINLYQCRIFDLLRHVTRMCLVEPATDISLNKVAGVSVFGTSSIIQCLPTVCDVALSQSGSRRVWGGLVFTQ